MSNSHTVVVPVDVFSLNIKNEDGTKDCQLVWPNPPNTSPDYTIRFRFESQRCPCDVSVLVDEVDVTAQQMRFEGFCSISRIRIVFRLFDSPKPPNLPILSVGHPDGTRLVRVVVGDAFAEAVLTSTKPDISLTGELSAELRNSFCLDSSFHTGPPFQISVSGEVRVEYSGASNTHAALIAAEARALSRRLNQSSTGNGFARAVHPQ